MIIAVFKERNQTLYFSQLLSNLGIKNRIINTPKYVGASCSLSCEFDGRFFLKAKEFVNSGYLSSFRGFYSQKNGKWTKVLFLSF